MVHEQPTQSTMNLVADKLSTTNSNKILVSGCYDKTRYASTDAIIDDFGLETGNGYYNTTGYEKAVAIASMGRSMETREVLPFVGEFAGRLVKNLSDGLMNVAGSRYGRLEDNSGNLIRFNTDDLTRLNQAKIIAIVNDADTGCNIIAGDCMRNRSGISVTYTLLFDVVETAVQKFFDEYAIRCSRLKETEKLKHLLEEKIAEFGVQSDVSYTTVGNEIRFVAKLYYKNIIREIIVNFMIS